MSYFSRFESQNPLACRSISSDLAKTQQKGLVPVQLAVSFAACAIAPFYLAFHGAPALWEMLTFVWAILPLAGVGLITRTGKPGVFEALSSFSFIAIGLTLAIGGGHSCQAALAWLILAPLLAVLTADRLLIVVSASAAVLAILGCAILQATGFIVAPGFSFTVWACFLVPAVGYAVALPLSMAQGESQDVSSAQLHANRYQAISEAIGDVVVCFDHTGSAAFVSADCETRLSLRQQDLIGRGFFEHIHVADRPLFLKAIADAIAAAERMSITMRLRSSLSAPKETLPAAPLFLWVEMHVRPFDELHEIRSLKKSGIGIAAILRDVTKARQREEELEVSRATAERISRSKDQFLANMSHELRTPLNAIIGFAEMLSNSELAPRDPAKQQEYAEIIRHSGLHLLSVVNSILDMSKLQSGSFALMPEPFEIVPLIDLGCDMIKLKANEGDIELVRAYAADIPEIVGDKQAYKQIVINLLSNAIKFTPAKGRVTISAQPEGNSLVIRVTDTGIGIDPQDLRQIGDPFFQASASYNRAYDGTGLGLSIVRGLVGLHGGTIALESEPGKGTSVTVRLPQDCRQAFIKPKLSAEFTTIPRRTRPDDVRNFPTDMMVKKIA